MRNLLAIIAAIFIGSLVNMGLITLGGVLISAPAGVDNTDIDSLAATMHLFELKHFIFPFLAHAIGTLSGALVAAKIGSSHQAKLAMIIGVFFLAGGIAASYMLPAPVWFMVLDLVVAYLPMAWLGHRLVKTK